MPEEEVLPKDEDNREGNLREVTDEEWREAHESLRGVLPPEEFAYRWQPGQAPLPSWDVPTPSPEETPDAP